MKAIIAVALSVTGTAALACYVPPPALFRAHEAMLSEASVVLVVVAEGTKAGCKLKVERTLKGEPPRSLPQCRAPAKGDWMTTFDAHGDARFWKENHGRLGINGDCSLVAPAFTIGKRYLLLIGVQPDTKQAEELGANDRWLAFAEAHLNGKKRGA